MVENPPANAGDVRGAGLIPGLGRSPGDGQGNPLSILAWKIPWTEEPDGLLSIGLQGADTIEQLTLSLFLLIVP